MHPNKLQYVNKTTLSQYVYYITASLPIVYYQIQIEKIHTYLKKTKQYVFLILQNI